MSVDKTAVHEDYVNGYSIRMLAAKYDVPKSTVGRWVKQYGWVQQQKYKERKRLTGSRDTEERDAGTRDTCIVQLGEPLPADEDYTLIRSYTQKLLKKADDLLELDDALAPRDLKSLSSMLLDVRTLLNILSPREAAEQEMRLSALKRQAQEEQKTSAEVTVRFVDTEGAEV